MVIELREGVYERTVNYVVINCAVMGLVIKELEKLDLPAVGDSIKVLKDSLKETNQFWAIRETEAELCQSIEQSRMDIRGVD